jgi:hypothetical protein
VFTTAGHHVTVPASRPTLGPTLRLLRSSRWIAVVVSSSTTDPIRDQVQGVSWQVDASDSHSDEQISARAGTAMPLTKPTGCG